MTYYNPNNVTKAEGPPYKSPRGQYYTQALFYEHYKANAKRASTLPVFCLKPHKVPVEEYGCIVFHDTFVEEGDPTGYRWAMKYLGRWRVWERLLQYEWFQEGLAAARAELEQKLESDAISRIREIMETGNPAQALQASKYLAEQGYKVKNSKRGRPSKEEVEAELKKQAKLSAEEQDDLARIGGLKLIQGGKNGD
jgi:hypothetical protein